MSRIFLLLAFIFLLGAGNALAKGAGGGGGHGGGGGGHATSGAHASFGHATSGAHASFGHATSGAHASFGHASLGHSSGIAHANFSSRATFSQPVRSSFGAHTYGPRTGPHSIVGTQKNNTHDYYYNHEYLYRNHDSRDTMHLHRRMRYGYMQYYGWYDPYYYPWDGLYNAPYSYYPYSPDYVAGETSGENTDNSYDGYVVYEYDTVNGLISLEDGEITLVQRADTTNRTYHYKTTDQKLQNVVVYNDDGRELSLVRLDTHKRKLWRVVHEGRVSVYDDTFDFLYDPADVDKDGLIVTYANYQVDLGLFTPRQKLVLLINNTYGTQLDAKDYNWTQLFTYIDQLD